MIAASTHAAVLLDPTKIKTCVHTARNPILNPTVILGDTSPTFLWSPDFLLFSKTLRWPRRCSITIPMNMRKTRWKMYSIAAIIFTYRRFMWLSMANNKTINFFLGGMTLPSVCQQMDSHLSRSINIHVGQLLFSSTTSLLTFDFWYITFFVLALFLDQSSPRTSILSCGH